MLTRLWKFCRLPACATAGLLLVTSVSGQKAPPAPKTNAQNVTETIHGVTITDPYRWLEDQESPETRAWIDAQNRYTRSLLDPLPGRAAVRREIESLYRIDEMSAPRAREGRYFIQKRAARENRFKICMRAGPDGPEKVLVDPAKVSSDPSTFVWIRHVSRDGKPLAYGIQHGGEDEMILAVLDVDSGRDLPDRLPRATYYDVFLLPDHSGMYYSRRDSSGTRLRYHPFGTDPANDKTVFGEGYDDEKLIWFQFSEDGRYIGAFVAHGFGTKTEVFVDDRTSQAGFRPLVTDLDAPFQGQFGGDHLFLRTTWRAPNWRILDVDLKHPARENWREVVPASHAVLEYFAVAKEKLILTYLENVNSQLKVVDTSGKPIGDIPLPTLGSAGVAFCSWDSDEIFWSFSSFAYVPTTFRYNLETKQQSVWFRPKVPLDLDDIETKQVWFKSKDGTRVPMFVVARKDTPLDGNRAVYLTAYGGYGASVTPWFIGDIAPWVQRGGVFALPNIRGGGEFGEPWHRAGMLENKQNSFDDFLAAAEWLIANHYTRPSRLVIEGGSNGGLLVGAAMTQRPDLFQAVICEYPHLDMIRYHKFLKAAPWVKEYGSPDDPKQFAYLYAYSPYHHVKKGTKYPATLFITGDADTRVAPLHARKMTALVQAATASDRPILLRYSTTSGHSGGQTVDQRIEESTDKMMFLLWQVGALPSSGD